jgi:hypothetical protein
LRSADLDQFAQLRIKTGLIDIRLECCNRLIGGRAYFGDIKSLLHEDSAMFAASLYSQICVKKMPGVWPLRDNRVDMERRLR